MNNNTKTNYHYYGDTLRLLFVLGGLIMIVSYPFFSSFIKAPIALSIVGIVTLVFFAGLMNPKQRGVMILNTIISTLFFFLFEYAAVYTYTNLSPSEGIHVAFFWINQVLSLVFFFASYLSVKTLRGAFVKEI
jgi:hypothetical protein